MMIDELRLKTQKITSVLLQAQLIERDYLKGGQSMPHLVDVHVLERDYDPWFTLEPQFSSMDIVSGWDVKFQRIRTFTLDKVIEVKLNSQNYVPADGNTWKLRNLMTMGQVNNEYQVRQSVGRYA
jgi:hypothetical protein